MITRKATIGGRLSTRTPLKGRWRLFTVRLGGRLRRYGKNYQADSVEVPQGERLVVDDEEVNDASPDIRV